MPPTKIPDCLRRPGADEVHVWTALVSEALPSLGILARQLSDEERQKAARFVRSEDRSRYLVAHGILRQLLGRYLRVGPAALTFVTNSFGKPALVQDAGQPLLSFNLAHSGDVVLFAMAMDRRVGVDIEAIRTDLDLVELARRQFSSGEAGYLQALHPTEQAEAFFRCWTRKESYLKARGDGLGFPLKQFSVSFGREEPPAVWWAADDSAVAERWSVFDFAGIGGYAGAVVGEGRPLRLVARRWVAESGTVSG